MFPLPKFDVVLTIDDFLPHVGSGYRVEATPAPVGIRLEQILRRSRLPWMVREPFLLVFSSPWNVLLVDARYRMTPEGGAPVQVHLVPTQSVPAERRYYHAVFN